MGRKNKEVQNKGNEEDGNYREKKTKVMVYGLDSDGEPNGDFGIAEHDDNRNNDNKDHIPRAKG